MGGRRKIQEKKSSAWAGKKNVPEIIISDSGHGEKKDMAFKNEEKEKRESAVRKDKRLHHFELPLSSKERGGRSATNPGGKY